MELSKNEIEVVHEGRELLQRLDMGGFTGETIRLQNGSLILAENCLDACPDDAKNAATGFMSLDADDPRFEMMKNVLRTHMFGLIGRTPEN